MKSSILNSVWLTALVLILAPNTHAKGSYVCGATDLDSDYPMTILQNTLVQQFGFTPVCRSTGSNGSSTEIHAFDSRINAKFVIGDGSGETWIEMVFQKLSNATYCGFAVKNQELQAFGNDQAVIEFCQSRMQKLKQENSKRYHALQSIAQGLHDVYKIAVNYLPRPIDGNNQHGDSNYARADLNPYPGKIDQTKVYTRSKSAIPSLSESSPQGDTPYQVRQALVQKLNEFQSLMNVF